jgi:hypothetical protein
MAAVMTGSSQEDYAKMMLAGGRSVEGNRSKSDQDRRVSDSQIRARRLLRCMSPFLAVRPEGAIHQWRKNPHGD